jgi:hypothetical protein
MNVKIDKTIGIGDAGLPFNVSIDVDYEQNGNNITITYCMEEESPYDNSPEKWYERIKEIIEDYFYDQDKNNKVIFL